MEDLDSPFRMSDRIFPTYFTALCKKQTIIDKGNIIMNYMCFFVCSVRLDINKCLTLPSLLQNCGAACPDKNF